MKTKKIIQVILGGLFISLALISCKKDKDTAPIDQPAPGPVLTSSLSGLGSYGGQPSGTPYILPSNIKIIGSMYGGSPGPGKADFNGPKTIGNIQQYLALMPKTEYTEYGYGTYVSVYMQLHNTGYSSYDLIIPAGLIMCDDDTLHGDTTQSGFIIAPLKITIPGDGTVDVCLNSFCLNAHFAIPYGNKYMFKVVTNNDQLHKVVTILQNKETLADHISDIQSILWDITDGSGLTQEDIDMMNSWQ